MLLSDHRREATAAWVLLLLAALPIAPRVTSALAPGGFSSPRMESQRVGDIVTGAPFFYEDNQAVTERDLRRAELISFPLAAVALLVVFGSVVAAFLPGLVGGTAVLITLACMALLSQVAFISIFSLNMVTML